MSNASAFVCLALQIQLHLTPLSFLRLIHMHRCLRLLRPFVLLFINALALHTTFQNFLIVNNINMASDTEAERPTIEGDMQKYATEFLKVVYLFLFSLQLANT